MLWEANNAWSRTAKGKQRATLWQSSARLRSGAARGQPLCAGDTGWLSRGRCCRVGAAPHWWAGYKLGGGEQTKPTQSNKKTPNPNQYLRLFKLFLQLFLRVCFLTAVVMAVAFCIFTVMKTEWILSVLRSFSGLKLISTVYLFNNASNEIILDSVLKYNTILLGLFRINEFLQHGETSN